MWEASPVRNTKKVGRRGNEDENEGRNVIYKLEINKCVVAYSSD